MFGDQSQSRVMEEKIWRLTRRIESLERKKRREEGKTSKVSSSEREEWNGRHQGLSTRG